MQEADVIEQWLKTISAERSEHKHNLLLLLDFIGKSAQQILNEYKAGSKKQLQTAYSQSLLEFTAHLRQQNF